MSVITDVLPQLKNKNRCNVFVDGEFSFAVSVDMVVKYDLRKNKDLNDELKKQIIEEDSKIYAFSLGIKYLSKTFKTKKQVIKYLKGKDFDDKTVFYVIDKLKEYGYIDDKEYVRRYLETYSSTQGKRLADYRLMMKGINKDDIESVRAEFFDDSKLNALKIAEKRLKNKVIDKNVLSKTYRYLIGKGFSYEDAEYAVSKFKERC
ncbi:MAG: RecX family transcriptional regulator [Clostridia bacterium]|nr:RecX family transcriptional regulator [Clostridia bacterium]